jgi:beta-glucosidase
MSDPVFPKNFAWGAATAAYQIEGGWDADGKGESVWDTFCRREGATFEAHDGRVACDHFHRWKEDVALMREIGLKAYRFSLSWPRILPDGDGGVNAAGLDFYDKLVDELLAAGVQPWATLFHWDLPQSLYLRGGWLNERIPAWFENYTRVVAQRLGDRVKNWMTLNEPQCFIELGLRHGIHAPGLKLGWADVLRAGHHALLAHGRAAQALREIGGAGFQIGWAPVGSTRIPATEAPADVEAARQDMFAITHKTAWTNTWWGDPVFFGHYPEDGLKVFGADVPKFTAGEMKVIATPIDFYGLNTYHGSLFKAGDDGKPQLVPHPAGTSINLYHWPVTFDVLRWAARYFHERYRKPIVITENGLANMDWLMSDGAVHDPQRIDFLSRQLTGLATAMREGADVRGYFTWSLMDNFEWQEGYRQRFGLVHVDFQTLRRTPKDSARWYREVIRSGGTKLIAQFSG